MSKSVYYEARGESFYGQLAVAQVILNRVKDERWPDTICEVVSQKGQFPWYPGNSDGWTQYRAFASKLIFLDSLGFTVSRTAKKSTFFNKVKFKDNRLIEDAVIDNHRFYSFKISEDCSDL